MNREKITNNKLINLINYLAIFAIFSEGFNFNINPLFEIRISLVILLFIIFLLLPFLKSFYINKTFFIIFLFIILTSFINVCSEKTNILLVSKQLLGVLISSATFYLIIYLNNYNIKKLFSLYMNFSFIVSLIGLIQFFSYKVGLLPLFDYSWLLHNWRLSFHGNYSFLRINSILPEPASFCIVISPAFFCSLFTFMKSNPYFLNRRKSLIIIAAFFLSFSTMGFIAIFVSVLVVIFSCFKFKRAIISLVGVLLCFSIFYFLIPDFKLRVRETAALIKGKMAISDVNMSTFTLALNALVTYHAIKENFIFGNGLGSHEISYNKYQPKIFNGDPGNYYFLNRNDANSLFLRILSEMGLFGLIAISLFLYKFYIRLNDKAKDFLWPWLINNSIFILMFMRLVRQGHYFSDGFFFFFWLYYFSKTLLHKNLIYHEANQLR